MCIGSDSNNNLKYIYIFFAAIVLALRRKKFLVPTYILSRFCCRKLGLYGCDVDIMYFLFVNYVHTVTTA